MVNNVVAYIGIDHFDIVLYLSRILSKLNRKVLVIDHTETQAVISAIPKPVGLEEHNYITYRGVDYTSVRLENDNMNYYDDILITYGFQPDANEIKYCTRLVFVTDLYLYNHNRLQYIEGKGLTSKEIERRVLIRNVVDVKFNQSAILNHINNEIYKDHISILYLNEQDYMNSLICYTNQECQFRMISKQLKNYLLSEIRIYVPDIKVKRWRTAFIKARRGD